MAVDRDLLNAFLAYLVAEGVVRRPDTAAELPPLWRAPEGGTPAPGEKTGTANDATTVLGVVVSGEIPRGPDRGYSDQPTIDLRIRTKDPKRVRPIANAITDLLAPPPAGVRQDWTMGGPVPGKPDPAEIYLIESRQWRGLQKLPPGQDGVFDYVVSYLFEVPLL